MTTTSLMKSCAIAENNIISTDNSVRIENVSFGGRGYNLNASRSSASLTSLHVDKVATLQTEWRKALNEAPQSARTIKSIVHQSRAYLRATLYQLEMLAELDSDDVVHESLSVQHEEHDSRLNDFERSLPKGMLNVVSIFKAYVEVRRVRHDIVLLHQDSLTASEATRRNNARRMKSQQRVRSGASSTSSKMTPVDIMSHSSST